jgi:hypothetical protein
MECSKKLSDKLERLQNQSLRIILCKNRKTCSQILRDKLGVLTLYNRRRFLRFLLIFKIVNNINCPTQLQDKLTRRSTMHTRTLRDTSILDIPRAKSSAGQTTFESSAARDWNKLPRKIRELNNLNTFKSTLYRTLLDEDRSSHRCKLNYLS